MKDIFITVRLTLRDDVDEHEVINEMDYSFSHKEDILDSEIVDLQSIEFLNF